MSTKPAINMRCNADRYAAPNEKIIEVSSPGGGCLISFRVLEDKHGAGDSVSLLVDVYRADATVRVMGARESTA